MERIYIQAGFKIKIEFVLFEQVISQKPDFISLQQHQRKIQNSKPENDRLKKKEKNLALKK